MCRQSVRGFCVKQPFRKGCWVKGARSLTALDKAEGLRAMRVVLTRKYAIGV